MYLREAPKDKLKRSKIKVFVFFLIATLLLLLAFLGYNQLFKQETIEEKVEYNLSFQGFTQEEEKTIRDEAVLREFVFDQPVTARAVTGRVVQEGAVVLDAYVPAVWYGDVRQSVTTEELEGLNVVMSSSVDSIVATALSENLGVPVNTGEVSEASEKQIAFVPVGVLDGSYKLLSFDGSYYLDSFDSGAVFRYVIFEGEDTSLLSKLQPTSLPDQDSVYKVNMTGVTALTRGMQRKLTAVNDPLYFSKFIGEFLSDADLTHVSNEVSFKPDCSYSSTLFCSPPEFIETLKDSGVDLVELTGNHNNDLGASFNTETIELYRTLGWDTVGGGLNSEEARTPVLKTAKGSDIAFLAYNFPDSPNGGAIAGVEKAGANSFDFTSIGKDIASAKLQSKFIIVNVQYWECYAYPEGYIEFPECDKPIGDQEANFKKLVDLGADMVVGSSAHQPQTYELYNGKPIYYGLGNLYFDQSYWPGTERGIILTHYFSEGRLLQTKLTPTVYDDDLQTRIMTESEAEYLLQRLSDAR